MVVALDDSRLIVSKQHPNQDSQPLFKPAGKSSFYGSHTVQKSLEEIKEERYRKTGRLLLLQRKAARLGNNIRARRDFEIFRDEKRKEIIPQCPELMLEYDEAVFRRAARAIWDEQDADTKQEYRAKADKEKGVGPSKKEATVKKQSIKRKSKKARVAVVKKRKNTNGTVVQERRQSPRLRENTGS